MAVAQNKKVYPGVNMDEAKEQVRQAFRRAFAECARNGRGGQSEFTRRLNDRLEREGRNRVTQQAVSWWATEGTFVDSVYWPHIEAISDMATTRRHLRPDIYGLGAP